MKRFLSLIVVFILLVQSVMFGEKTQLAIVEKDITTEVNFIVNLLTEGDDNKIKEFYTTETNYYENIFSQIESLVNTNDFTLCTPELDIKATEIDEEILKLLIHIENRYIIRYRVNKQVKDLWDNPEHDFYNFFRYSEFTDNSNWDMHYIKSISFLAKELEMNEGIIETLYNAINTQTYSEAMLSPLYSSFIKSYLEDDYIDIYFPLHLNPTNFKIYKDGVLITSHFKFDPTKIYTIDYSYTKGTILNDGQVYNYKEVFYTSTLELFQKYDKYEGDIVYALRVHKIINNFTDVSYSRFFVEHYTIFFQLNDDYEDGYTTIEGYSPYSEILPILEDYTSLLEK